ncbi:hypothetical protein GDO81_024562 [Engystomops pustulosus]|uniref:Uncharacterized protein n=1 Tax=Engystomops pustulosus TaxID=76066 RepID=A0AAV6ZB55_ENGPU|nr:hypothetical protein GDO81_024562 [Engystomops pustulosus]
MDQNILMSDTQTHQNHPGHIQTVCREEGEPHTTGTGVTWTRTYSCLTPGPIRTIRVIYRLCAGRRENLTPQGQE